MNYLRSLAADLRALPYYDRVEALRALPKPVYSQAAYLKRLRRQGGVGACEHCLNPNPERALTWAGRWECQECGSQTGQPLLVLTGRVS